MVTTLEIYLSVSREWSTRGQIARNLSILKGYRIGAQSRCLADLDDLEEIGYIESKLIFSNGKEKVLYRDSNNLEKARRKYHLKRAI